MSCKRQVQHVYSCLVRASKMTTHKRPPLYVAYTSLVLGQAVLPIPLARAVRCLNEPSARTCSPSNETIASSFRGSQRPFRCLPISNDAFKLCTSHPNDRTRLAPKPIARASDESACGGRKPGARCFTVHIMYGGDEVNAIVLEVGSSSCKAGYAGEDSPKAVFSSCCGVVARTENGGANPAFALQGGQGSSGRTIYAGSQALSYRRPQMEISPAMQNGIYSDWELVESIWQHAFSDCLRLRPEEHPIMLAEPVFNPRQTRERAVELMFETFRPPALFLAKNAVLSSFAVGRQTSLVVDLGHEGSATAAVHDGFVLQKSIVRTPLAGSLLSECMLQSVQSRGASTYPFSSSRLNGSSSQAKGQDEPAMTDSFRRFHSEQIAADIKESICRVSDTAFDNEANANIPTVDYELPDGTTVQVGPDRFNVPEVMFQPAVLKIFEGVTPVVQKGQEMCSIPASVMKSIELCDVDVRRDMYSGIIATGGTSLLAQLRDRLEREVAEIAPQAARVKVTLPVNNTEKRFSVWIGGSILASLGTFQQMWMSKSEYEEHGASLIHRRAP